MKECIFVPITLRGMLSGAPPENRGDYVEDRHRFADVSDDYSRIVYDPLGEYVPAQLSVHEDTQKGIHLHWSLPDALTRGVMEENRTEPKFSPVPDRWLLARMWAPLDDYNKDISLRCWVIVSNVLHETRTAANRNLGSVSIPYDDTSAGKPPFRFLGKSMTLGDYIKGGESDEFHSPLTAMIAGNPSHAAYYPTSRNVFGFYDDMTDESGKPVTDAAVTYCVIGFFSDAENDPLDGCAADKGLSISEALEALKWTLTPNDAKKTDADASIPEFPCQTVCHGMLYGIKWCGTDVSYDSGIPADPPDIAVGNSSAEALAALIARKSTKDGNTAENLECVLTHLLAGLPKEVDNQDGLIQSESVIHERRFGTHSVYEQLTLKAPETAEGVSPEPPSIELTELLRNINDLLWKKQRLDYEMQSLQEKMFDLWYRFEKLPAAQVSDREANLKALGATAKEIYRVRGELKALDVCGNKTALEALCEKEGYSLIACAGHRFWEPTDPVILLAGIQRDFSHGEDGVYSADGTLPVRNKTISKFSVSAQSQMLPVNASLSGSSLLKNHPKYPQAWEKTIIALLNECALISTSFCMQAARVMCEGTESSVPDVGITYRWLQRYGILGCTLAGAQAMAALSASAGMDAPFPEKTAVEYWKQPWYPMYLDWVADYYPDAPSADAKPDIRNWTGGHTENGFQYDFWFKGEMPLSNAAASFNGCNLITPHAAYNLAEKMAELDEIIPNAGCISVLSQKLGSFHSQLLMVNQLPMTARYKYADSKSTITHPETQNKTALYELMEDVMQGFTPRFPVFDALFAPVRAGFLRLRGLSIIDSFGQMQRVSDVSITTAESMRLSSENKNPGQNRRENLIELPPRLLEPSQMRFDWKDDSICGFLLPNFIDRNIQVFSSKCRPLGSIQSINIKGKPSVVWKAGISEGGRTSDCEKDIQNPHLLSFVGNILSRAAAETDVFELLLDNINSAMWQINPHLHGGAGAMGLLFGSPLVLARAEMSIRMMYPPRRYKSFYIEKARDVYDDVDIEALAVDVTVGIPHKHGDGTLGFFADEQYDTLYWSFPDDRKKPSAYIKYNPVVRLSPYFEGKKPRDVTLLIDPLGETNIHSGLLPVKSARLHQESIEKAIRELYHVSLVSPALQYGLEMRLPLPKTEGRRWTWAGFENGETVFKSGIKISDTFQGARFEDMPVFAREGWICLNDSASGEERA